MALGTHTAPLIARHSLPLRIHPENPKLFEFRDMPFVFETATEHCRAVMNRPFVSSTTCPTRRKRGAR
jgi:hypothetical protein